MLCVIDYEYTHACVFVHTEARARLLEHNAGVCERISRLLAIISQKMTQVKVRVCVSETWGICMCESRECICASVDILYVRVRVYKLSLCE
jgi:hypothetical protein